MIVRDFHVMCIAVRPSEAHPPLVVDADAVLPGAVSLELLQAVSAAPRDPGTTSELYPAVEDNLLDIRLDR
jgi:hypothetical protein